MIRKKKSPIYHRLRVNTDQSAIRPGAGDNASYNLGSRSWFERGQ